MNGLVFEANARAPVSAPERADVACFVGFVRRSGAPLPPEIQQWLLEQGWGKPLALDNVPVPIERWSDFARLFDSEGTYLGAAVRSFFAQGGRKCYVVRAAEPWPTKASRDLRATWPDKLLPGTGEQFEASPRDRTTWKGAAHLFGLPDVSFLCVPDLAAALAVDAEPLPPPVQVPASPEVFVDCTEQPPRPGEALTSTRAAPRCDEAGYERWSRFLVRLKTLLSRHVREVQLVAAIPLPGIFEETPYRFLLERGHLQRFQSAFVQLVYPWARTPGSGALPEGLESPEGLLTGVLARNALLRGTFRNAMNLELADVQDLFPLMARGTLSTPPPVVLAGGTVRPLLERVSMLGPSPGGLRVLSDVTTSPSETWRQAGVNRLLSVLLRAARRVGQDVVFEPSQARTWLALVYRLEAVLVRLWEVGALRGTNAREAFQVRCDRTTMTQDDIDAGRLVAEVEFDAAAAIERLHVILTVAEEGAISLRTEGSP
ncbi:MAG TPA: phage tail sheath protein [Archangium sp.]|uniref:phage tail sheath protein n=1 Tax=Archangium sp. TaxID=1872627 RepID=UPI002E33CC95|nr:phage tail sheath protein [Archangium sp.]HEX5745284.1 phage tail sheath protein [Archangium sp.]